MGLFGIWDMIWSPIVGLVSSPFFIPIIFISCMIYGLIKVQSMFDPISGRTSQPQHISHHQLKAHYTTTNHIDQPFLHSSATELGRFIREKSISSVELTRIHIDHILLVNPSINAVVNYRFQLALDEAYIVDCIIEILSEKYQSLFSQYNSILSQGVYHSSEVLSQEMCWLPFEAQYDPSEYPIVASLPSKVVLRSAPHNPDQPELLGSFLAHTVPPFFGVPCTTKECFALKGMPLASGLVHRSHNIALYTAPVVLNLQRAGFVIMGTTNTSEACMWMESNNYVYGRTNNPYSLRRTSGGSSGGEGALSASLGTSVSLGSDVGGSIRMPAFFNGIYGHKPTSRYVCNLGQWPPTRGGIPDLYCQPGPMCRYPADLWPLLQIMAQTIPKRTDNAPKNIPTLLDLHAEEGKDGEMRPITLLSRQYKGTAQPTILQSIHNSNQRISERVASSISSSSSSSKTKNNDSSSQQQHHRNISHAHSTGSLLNNTQQRGSNNNDNNNNNNNTTTTTLSARRIFTNNLETSEHAYPLHGPGAKWSDDIDADYNQRDIIENSVHGRPQSGSHSPELSPDLALASRLVGNEPSIMMLPSAIGAVGASSNNGTSIYNNSSLVRRITPPPLSTWTGHIRPYPHHTTAYYDFDATKKDIPSEYTVITSTHSPHTEQMEPSLMSVSPSSSHISSHIVAGSSSVLSPSTVPPVATTVPEPSSSIPLLTTPYDIDIQRVTIYSLTSFGSGPLPVTKVDAAIVERQRAAAQYLADIGCRVVEIDVDAMIKSKNIADGFRVIHPYAIKEAQARISHLVVQQQQQQISSNKIESDNNDNDDTSTSSLLKRRGSSSSVSIPPLTPVPGTSTTPSASVSPSMPPALQEQHDDTTAYFDNQIKEGKIAFLADFPRAFEFWSSGMSQALTSMRELVLQNCSLDAYNDYRGYTNRAKKISSSSSNDKGTTTTMTTTTAPAPTPLPSHSFASIERKVISHIVALRQHENDTKRLHDTIALSSSSQPTPVPLSLPTSSSSTSSSTSTSDVQQLERSESISCISTASSDLLSSSSLDVSKSPFYLAISSDTPSLPPQPLPDDYKIPYHTYDQSEIMLSRLLYTYHITSPTGMHRPLLSESSDSSPDNIITIFKTVISTMPTYQCIFYIIMYILACIGVYIRSLITYICLPLPFRTLHDLEGYIEIERQHKYSHEQYNNTTGAILSSSSSISITDSTSTTTKPSSETLSTSPIAPISSQQDTISTDSTPSVPPPLYTPSSASLSDITPITWDQVEPRSYGFCGSLWLQTRETLLLLFHLIISMSFCCTPIRIAKAQFQPSLSRVPCTNHLNGELCWLDTRQQIRPYTKNDLEYHNIISTDSNSTYNNTNNTNNTPGTPPSGTATTPITRTVSPDQQDIVSSTPLVGPDGFSSSGRSSLSSTHHSHSVNSTINTDDNTNSVGDIDTTTTTTTTAPSISSPPSFTTSISLYSSSTSLNHNNNNSTCGHNNYNHYNHHNTHNYNAQHHTTSSLSDDNLIDPTSTRQHPYFSSITTQYKRYKTYYPTCNCTRFTESNYYISMPDEYRRILAISMYNQGVIPNIRILQRMETASMLTSNIHGPVSLSLLQIFTSFLPSSQYSVPALILALIDRIGDISPSHTLNLWSKCLSFSNSLNTLLQQTIESPYGSVLLCPPHPVLAPPHYLPCIKPFNFVYTGIFNATMSPVTSVPLGLYNNLPTGIQVVGSRHCDATTIAIALQLHRYFGGWQPGRKLHSKY